MDQPTPAPGPRVTLSNPAGLYDPAPNGYSHLAVVPAGTRLLQVAGQGGEDATGALPPEFQAQVRQAFANLLTALAGVGAGPGDVAKLTVLIVDHSEARLHVLGAELDRVWGKAMKPACTLIPVPRLALDDMLFEVEAVAAVAA
jgi:enamine deaminase RidA (YjgF/YER057c/UK114 family)